MAEHWKSLLDHAELPSTARHEGPGKEAETTADAVSDAEAPVLVTKDSKGDCEDKPSAEKSPPKDPSAVIPALPGDMSWASTRACRSASAGTGMRAMDHARKLRCKRTESTGLQSSEVREVAEAIRVIARRLVEHITTAPEREAFISAVGGAKRDKSATGEVVMHSSLHEGTTALVGEMLKLVDDVGDGRLGDLTTWLARFQLDPEVVDGASERKMKLVTDMEATFRSVHHANALMEVLHSTEQDS